MPIEISTSAKLFNLNEAQELLPVILKITHVHCQELEPLQHRLDRMLSNDPRRAQYEQQYERFVSTWRGKIERLGAIAAGLWVVEFDVGDGVLSWRYPELLIAHYRPLNKVIRSRLADYIEENDPDWAL